MFAVLELKKLPPEAQSEKGILRWMRFLHGKNRKEFEYMAEKDEYIREAYDTLVQMSADEKKQMEYKAREKALRDYQSQMQSAETAGFRKGLKRAKRVFQLNAQGKTPAEIADICQLTEQDVRDILE
ncbi:MAG TPA: Rpn family recombination-promoting nuclease/putative transposase [Candidatus Fusicatenibacter merdavium]|uniref:Rpn family recombination-promoting nuclease/putative transposase n=1 Tax=Candidatus Fusicatenibacter merdavium TaxID=2838600 RepID=A0A9D1XDI3_9FIRM|nr:Rpn family recombination-promoting nuclease/putative transposase [Candidatus Fusicatenibacter merdavium]